MQRPTLSLLLTFISTLVLSGEAVAQDRASFAQIMADTCKAADVNGDAYRPGYCPARCDCSLAERLSEVTECTVQTGATGSPTLYRMSSAPSTQQCLDLFGISFNCFSGEGCTSDANCTSPYVCFTAYGVCIDSLSAGDTCTTAADCPVIPGPTLPDRWTVRVEQGGSSSAVAECADNPPLPGTTTTHMPNQKDALDCVAQVEAALGSACTEEP